MNELNRNEHCPCWHQVADFNLSKMMEETGSMASGSTMARVNPRWLAPEVLNGAQASVSSDVFAFGVVLWGASLFPGGQQGRALAGRRRTAD